VATKQSGEDAPIKGRSNNEGEAAAERTSNDSEEIARVVDPNLGNNKWYQSLLRNFDHKKNNFQTSSFFLKVLKYIQKWNNQTLPLPKSQFWTQENLNNGSLGSNSTGSTSESSAMKKRRTVAITTEDMQKRRNDTFGGNEATKKIKKNQLKQQYGNFKAEGSGTLEQTFNRLQAIVSHLEFMDVEIKRYDLNQNFLTILAPEWLVYTIVWRNRNDVKTLTNTSSGKGKINTTSVPTASTQVSPASANVAAASISHDTVCAYIASQSNGSQIKYDDINQINEDDIKEMDIKECRAPRSQDRGKRENYKQGSKEVEPAPKALMAIDGVEWDWSYMDNEEENHTLAADDEAPAEFPLMANLIQVLKMRYLMTLRSKSCKKKTDSLNTKITNLKEALSDRKANLYHYKLGLSQVEARLVEFKTQKIKLCEKIRGLEFDVKNKNTKIKNLMNEPEQIKKEKEVLSPPPSPAQVYSPPKKDMSWTGLPEFADDTITDYNRPSPSIKTSQSFGSQIKYEDINQIDEDDIEEMDINQKWSALTATRWATLLRSAGHPGAKIGVEEKTSNRVLRFYGGSDEEPSDVGSLRVIVYIYDGLLMHLVSPPSPDYVPEPKHPPSANYMPGPKHPPLPVYVRKPEYAEYLVSSEDEAPVEDQPLPADALPTALSLGYMADSYPEKDHDDYPIDGGDGDDEPFDDDEDDDDDDTDDEDKEAYEDKDDKEDEKEHLAPINFSAISSPPLRVSSLLLPLPSPLTTSPTDVEAPLGYRALKIRIRALLPSTSHRTDILEAEMPPRKTACLTTLTFRFEVEESSAAAAARLPGLDVVVTDATARCLMSREVGYGITDTWDEIVKAMLEIPPTTLK
nr:hypothetical protein [Tanacetum cinerariifolium]